MNSSRLLLTALLLLLQQGSLLSQEYGAGAGVPVMKPVFVAPHWMEKPASHWKPGLLFEGTRLLPGRNNDANLRHLSIGISAYLPSKDSVYVRTYDPNLGSGSDTVFPGIQQHRLVNLFLRRGNDFKIRGAEFLYFRIGLCAGIELMKRSLELPGFDEDKYWLVYNENRKLVDHYQNFWGGAYGGIVYELEKYMVSIEGDYRFAAVYNDFSVQIQYSLYAGFTVFPGRYFHE